MILDNETKKNSILQNKSTWESIKDIQVLLTLMLQKNYRGNHRNILLKIRFCLIKLRNITTVVRNAL